jgi:hypothetical protein
MGQNRLVFMSDEVFKNKKKGGNTLCVHIIKAYSDNESQQDAQFLNFILVKNSTCFGQTYCLSPGVLILYTQQLVFVILVMLTVC